MKSRSPRTTRRDLLRAGAGCTAALMSSGARAFASGSLDSPAARDTLVLVFLRGGMDGLSLFVPVGDADYYIQRPTLGVPAQRTINLDGFFGLNDAAAPLYPHFAAGELAVVHGCGIAHPTRSHFEAMRRMEEAHVGGGTFGSGWLARHLQATPPVQAGGGRAIAIDRTLPTAMQGGFASIPIPRLAEFGFSGPLATQVARANRLDAMYSRASQPDRGGGLTALDLASTVDAIDFTRAPSGGAVYPSSSFGEGLYETATLIKAGTSVEAVEVDYGGWDDHSHEGPVGGFFAGRIHDLANGLSAFLTDLGPDAERTTVVVMSEFGRRVDENGAGGCDHGRGGAVMVLGGSHVNGGVVHRLWPGLQSQNLDDGALPVSIDIRHVMAEILTERMGTADLAAALPGFSPTPLGLVT